ncbi:MAG: hypothetical protein ABSH13_05820 [Candidatus Acidiferrum sp.]|jgi:hypothetical protein
MYDRQLVTLVVMVLQVVNHDLAHLLAGDITRPADQKFIVVAKSGEIHSFNDALKIASTQSRCDRPFIGLGIRAYRQQSAVTTDFRGIQSGLSDRHY